MSAKLLTAAGLVLGLGMTLLPHGASAQGYGYGYGDSPPPPPFDDGGPGYGRGPGYDGYGGPEGLRPPPPPPRVRVEVDGYGYRGPGPRYGGPGPRWDEGDRPYHPPRPAYRAYGVDYQPVGPSPSPDLGCTTQRRVTGTSVGWRKIVTHRVCYVR